VDVALIGLDGLSAAQIALLIAAGFLAGLIDAMVGGGGLIQVPALVALFPGFAPATIMGTSKFAGVFGTFSAYLQYARHIAIPKRTLLYGALFAALGALLGAYLLTLLSNEVFKRLLPVLLLLVFVYTLLRKDFGGIHRPRFSPAVEPKISATAGAVIGVYDGFFGPGTGSFLVFIFVRWFGFDFVHASALAKGINVACNVAALTLFIGLGHMVWASAMVLAVANLSGGITGSKLALKYGSAWVRKVFILVVAALIIRTTLSVI
jgi:uncharacterized protein